MSHNTTSLKKEGLVKIDETIEVRRVTNGYVVESHGRNSEDDWVGVKIICGSLDEVVALLDEHSKLPLNV
jgi:hypothetical protein